MGFVFHDGGRLAAGYKGRTGDCVTRSIAIVTGRPYQEVYDALNEIARSERMGKRKRKRSNSRTGVFRYSYHRYMQSLGWRWTSTMSIGSGCQVHLCAAELPQGTLLVKVSRHLTAVIDGVIHDTHDCSAAVRGVPMATSRWAESLTQAGQGLMSPPTNQPPLKRRVLHASHHGVEDCGHP